MKVARYLDDAGQVRSAKVEGEKVLLDSGKIDLDSVDLLPPCEPDKILGIGKNYPNKSGDTEDIPEGYPAMPRVYIKTPNCLVKNNGVVKLHSDREFKFGGEIGVVIGEQCKNVSKESAKEHVWGYTCANDITQFVENRRYGLRFKSFDQSAPLGPILVNKDIFPADAEIRTFKNGDLVQRGTYSDTIYSEGEMIEKISEHMTLNRGDVILTGSPPPSGNLTTGDSIKVEVDEIGSLTHTVK